MRLVLDLPDVQFRRYPQYYKPYIVEDPEKLAKRFHDLYEKLAPNFGYETRKESSVPWEDVPENNKNLMIEVCRHIIKE